MAEMSKHLWKLLELPFLYKDKLMKYLSDGGMHEWCGSPSQKINNVWRPLKYFLFYLEVVKIN